MAFNKYDVLSSAFYHYYSFNAHYCYYMNYHYRSYCIYFSKTSTCYSETSLSGSSCREVMQDKEDLGEKFGQRTKFSFLGRDPVCDLRSKQSGEQSWAHLQFPPNLETLHQACFLCGASLTAPSPTYPLWTSQHVPKGHNTLVKLPVCCYIFLSVLKFLHFMLVRLCDPGGSWSSLKVGPRPSESPWIFRMSWSEELSMWGWLTQQMAE